jgi:hypothetical protein
MNELTLSYPLLEGFCHCSFPIQVHCQKHSDTGFTTFLLWYGHMMSVKPLMLYCHVWGSKSKLRNMLLLHCEWVAYRFNYTSGSLMLRIASHQCWSICTFHPHDQCLKIHLNIILLFSRSYSWSSHSSEFPHNNFVCISSLPMWTACPSPYNLLDFSTRQY